MNLFNVLLLSLGIVTTCQVMAQSTPETPHSAMCGSHELIQHRDNQYPGYEMMSDQMMSNLQSILQSNLQAKDLSTVYTLPVVFHVVYNTPTENIHDSLIYSQLDVLNECFRRLNADTVNMRTDFENLVGDVKIQFELATVDPQGNSTSGITRTPTLIYNFMGDMTDPNFYQDIYSNVFRITDDQNGGVAAWNTDQYINVWIGDLSASTGVPGQSEEMLIGLATPPLNHSSFINVLDMSILEEDGVILHYKSVGANNPIPYSIGSAANNNKSGKTMVHEMGHYLGLRHIWGDGDCGMDDYILDTPLAASASVGSCSFNLNDCWDDINGQNLPNMVENYMDYSTELCQNSFTIGQIEMMRLTLSTYRSGLLTNTAALTNLEPKLEVELFPNPATGPFSLKFNTIQSEVQLVLTALDGKVISNKTFRDTHEIKEDMELANGMYLLNIYTQEGAYIKKRLIISE